ncbi:poly-beta-1,6 N-acetyl-D-glucosamine export porin PgaA [Pseudoxanthomonas indica]|uniref:Poly-beta-1,6 N-acetyl-D-glucosamine export porin PgaA n=1 Tax=Pseudoxanthomonas indica TaxID=428993 RepID=A0A1T5IWU1_9GAMM|nr:poly-beta-1,6 N-acetyl-D-glucosamine export porin PgaA [Pseudoxanthomonas indica]
MDGALRSLAWCLAAATGWVAPLAWADETGVSQLMQEGRSALRDDDRYLALKKFALAHAREPANREASNALADVLMQLGAPQAAANVLETPGFPVRGGQAAERVRWGAQVEEPDPTQPFAQTDAAIALLQRLATEARSATPPDREAERRSLCDLVVALRNRERWSEALALAEDLQRAAPLPAYVRLAQADAQLALERPEQALASYLAVLEADPANRQARVGLVYAQVETEDFAAAFATADALAAEGAPRKRVGASTATQPDADWLDAQLLAAQVRRYADMPLEAWQRVRPLLDAAPASPSLRWEMSAIAAARGWPRQAHHEALVAWSLAPADPTAQFELANAEWRRGYWASAAARIERMALARPTHSQVRRLQDEVSAHNDAQVLLSFAPRRAEGGGSTAPGSGMTGALRLYSPPLRENWRLLAAAEREVDKPDHETLTRNRYGAGIEGRWSDLSFELIGWSNQGLLEHGGADASVQWQPDDHWTLAADLQRFSADTPLRAIQAGVRADAYGVRIAHAWDDQHVASFSTALLDFSDGNRRWQATADYLGRIVNQPGLDVLLHPTLYASRNSLRDTAYFNPERDASFSLGVDVRHLIWRRYQRSLRQRVLANYGRYWQSGFGSGDVGGVEYSQTYSHDPRTAWEYGFAWARHIYDGDAERSLTAFIRFEQRF